MEIDLYQACPCHAEKKIKFCCGKEVVGSLNGVLERHKSRQTAAALDDLEKLIASQGPKDCLLLACSQLQLALGKIDEAEKSVRQFLATNPGHSLGLERLATILAAQHRGAEAWSALQDAMDNLPGSNVPVAFASGFRYVGLALLSEGFVLAARIHASMACFLEQSDPQTDQLCRAVEESARMLVLTRSFAIEPLPDAAPETPWKKKYVNAVRAQKRGQYRKAVQLIGRALELGPDEPVLLRAFAMAATLQPDFSQLVHAFRQLSGAESFSLAERVESEMLAQYFDPTTAGNPVNVVSWSWSIRDLGEAREKLNAHNQFVEIDPGDSFDEMGEGQPPPRGAYAVLDRPAMDRVEASTTHEQIPVVMARILAFGKQTDGEARLEVLLSRGKHFDTVGDLLGNVLGELGTAGEEAVIDQVEAEQEALTAAWHLPASLSREEHERLTRDRQFFVASEVLPATEFGVLGGKSLREAASDPAMGVRCQSLICNLELSNDAREWSEEWGAQARKAIGLPVIPQISGIQPEKLSTLSPFLVRYLDLGPAETIVLVRMFSLCMMCGDFRGIRKVAPLLLERDDIGQTPESGFGAKVRVHLALADLSADDERCFEHIAQARLLAKKAGMPVGLVLVREFEQSLLRSRFEKLKTILREIELHHLQEDQVREALTRVLTNYGLISPDGQLMLPADRQNGAEQKADSGVWTPESAGAGQAKSGSGLWIPGE